MSAFQTINSHSGVGAGGELTAAQETNVQGISALAASAAGEFLRKTSTTAYENAAVVVLATGTSGTDFDISSSGTTHTFNLPDASATARGVLSTGIQTIAGDKTFSDDITVGGNLTIQGAITSAINQVIAGDVSIEYTSPTALVVKQQNGNVIFTVNTQAPSVDLGTSVSFGLADDALFNLGTDNDVAFVLRSTALTANTVLTGVFVGTPVVPALAANSLVISNVTADGDIVLATQTGTNSQANLFIDASAGSTHILAAGVNTFTLALGRVTVTDDIVFQIGTSGDGALVNSSAGVGADTGLASVLIGTPESQAVAANSLLISNITASGDIGMYVNKGGASQMVFFADGSTGDTAIMASSGQSVDTYIAGTKEIDYATGAMAFQQATTLSTTTGILTIDGDDGILLQTTGSGSVVSVENLVLGTGEQATGTHATAGLTLRASDHPGGTDTDSPGADITISPGLGTGDGDAGTIIFSLPEVVGTGTVVQTRAAAITFDMVASTSVTTITLNNNAIVSGTWNDLGIATTIDINGGTIDGTTIGAASASSIIGTTIDATTDFTIGGTVITDGVITDTGVFVITPTSAISLGSGEAGTTAATGMTLRAPDITTGGAGNVAGADLTIAAGLGTGTGDEGTIIFQLPIVAGAGDFIQTRATRMTLDMAGSATELTMSFAQATTISTSSGTLTITAPTLTTPALGTPASGVMTNVTGIPVGALANGTDGELITWGADAVATTVATGSSGQVLTSNGAGAAPTFQAAAGGGGLSFEAMDATERTTTSVSAVDLVTITGLSIAAGTRVRVVGKARKTAGAASGAGIGLKINATDVVAAATNANAIINFSGTNQAEDGIFEIEFEVGETNYQTNILGSASVRASSGGASFSHAFEPSIATLSAILPAATITDIILTGIVGDAAVTLAAVDVRVYTYANA